MELRDFIVAPIIIILVYIVAYFIRPMLTNKQTSSYYFPALTLKIIGALALGLIYQFYYGWGDTFNYHTHGSRIVWEATINNPSDGIKLFFQSKDPQLIQYTPWITFYEDPNSFFVVRVAALFDLLTFSSYAGTAVLFAFFSFLGLWYLFLTFYELFPSMHKWFATAAFFIPSLFFWGSGILKDTILMGCLGLATYQIKRLFLDKKSGSWILLLLSLYLMFSIKKYVLLCFVPAVIFWIYAGNLFKIKSAMVRLLLFPVIVLLSVFSGFYGIKKIGESDSKYALDQIANTAMVTAYDIRYYSGRGAGSGYSLGELDGSFSSMLKLAPQAINVTLFRPYLWEVNNVLMLLSALEALALFLFTAFLFLRNPATFFRSFTDPNILFCFAFSIAFAFAVGVSTFNFGTLVRYKIPMLPFYVIGLGLVFRAQNQFRDEKAELALRH